MDDLGTERDSYKNEANKLRKLNQILLNKIKELKDEAKEKEKDWEGYDSLIEANIKNLEEVNKTLKVSLDDGDLEIKNLSKELDKTKKKLEIIPTIQSEKENLENRLNE